MKANRNWTIFISSAEPSADEHCAGLINALKKMGEEMEFAGFGGEKMRLAGCNLVENTAKEAVMGVSAIGQAARFIGLINKAKKFFKEQRPDLVIVCDSPSFNFHIAKSAKKAGVKTLFFVAPQLWAWGGWRIKKMRMLCDRLCCILPFEQEWFGQRGIATTFVGNPLLDGAGRDITRNIKEYGNYRPQKAKIVILPGSRQGEIEALWGPMQEIAIKLKQRYSDIAFNAIAVDEGKLSILKSKQIEGFDCRYDKGNVIEAAREADFAIVASGSATLQTAAAGCPMVVMYQSGKLFWHLWGKFLIKTKYLSLVNILAGKELVPEFMPYFTSIEPIVKAVEKLLEDKDNLARLSEELVRLTEPMSGKDAAQKVAEIVVEMLGAKRNHG